MSRKLLAVAVGVFAILASLALTSAAGAHTRDRNRDRIPDRWERQHHLSLKVNQARRDQDHDGLDNRGEFQAGLDPHVADTDHDGIDDGDENAGTIGSFTGGVLTVNLAGGGTLTATVTPDTEIECDTATASTSGGDDPGDDDEQGDDQNGDGEHGDHHGGGDDEGEGGNCGAEALTQGRQVKEGELKTANGGAVWEKVELG